MCVYTAEIVVCHTLVSMYSIIIKRNYLDSKCVSNKLIMMAAGAKCTVLLGRACVRAKYSHEQTVSMQNPSHKNSESNYYDRSTCVVVFVCGRFHSNFDGL